MARTEDRQRTEPGGFFEQLRREHRPFRRRFTLTNFNEIIDEYTTNRGERPNDVMLSRQQFDELMVDIPTEIRIPIQNNTNPVLEGVRIHINDEPVEAMIPTQPETPPGNIVLDDPVAANRTHDWIRHEEITDLAPEQDEQDVTENFSRDWIGRHMRIHERHVDYDTSLVLSGHIDIPITNAYRFPPGTETNQAMREAANNTLLERFYRQANNMAGTTETTRTPVVYNIDDNLRDFIFWLHSNVKDEIRLEADIKFGDMRDAIWPSNETEETG